MSNWPTYQAPPQIDLPPWGWNPAATFLTAYNTQRIADQKTKEMEMSNEIDRILFPAKVAQAQFELKKLNYASKLLENQFRTDSAEIDQRYQIASGKGASSNVAGNVGSSNQAPAQDEDPTSFNLTGTVYDRKSAAQPQTGSQPITKKPVVDLTSVK